MFQNRGYNLPVGQEIFATNIILGLGPKKDKVTVTTSFLHPADILPIQDHGVDTYHWGLFAHMANNSNPMHTT